MLLGPTNQSALLQNTVECLVLYSCYAKIYYDISCCPLSYLFYDKIGCTNYIMVVPCSSHIDDIIFVKTGDRTQAASEANPSTFHYG